VVTADTHRTIRSVWRNESARIVAGLVRLTQDVDLAEELAQDALVAALEEWPRAGIPENPGAWLTTVAKNRALSALQRKRMLARKHEAIEHETSDHVSLEAVESAIESSMDDVGDDMLRLLFISCHPVLSTEARVALTLRLLGGLSTDEIARAFLASEPTIAQRIVRAKRTLAEASIPFELPPPEALDERLSSVLEVVYLIFNEGYVATSGADVMRPSLTEESLRLARLLAEIAPNEPEAFGLLALMELTASRAPARVDANGEPVLLDDQDRTRWDRGAIDRGLAALEHAEALAESRGPYTLQAAIAACHATASSGTATDWKRIADLYGELARIGRSPVIELNRAIAISRAEGPAAGLALLDALAAEPALASYHLLPSARADLLLRLGRRDEARTELERAASLTKNERQRERLSRRARGLAG
jgi:RNA polymerase sigma factor (sigma-70 family)